MALRQYRIPVFYGLAQGETENRLNDGDSPDACNMDTRGGRLSVASGYVREHDAAFPAPADVLRLFVWNRAGGRHLLAATAKRLYTLDETAGQWRLIYTFAEEAEAAQYDVQTVKIASTEYLLVASGVSRMAKWDGVSEEAEAFGSAEGLSDIAVNYVSSIIHGSLPRGTRSTRAGSITARHRATSAALKTGRARRRAKTSAAGSWMSVPIPTPSRGCLR